MNHRPLKKIEAELATALERGVMYNAKATGQLIKTGGLLAEAKEQLDEHGAWLLWLADHFPRTPRTAQKYMAAHALLVEFKCELDSHLNLSPNALYVLVENYRGGRHEVVKVALDEARTQWVDDDRVYEIQMAWGRQKLDEDQQKLDEAIGARGEDQPSDEAPQSDEARGEESAAEDEAQPDEAGDEEPKPDAEGRDEASEDKPEDKPAPAPEPKLDDDRPPPTPPPPLNPRQAAQLSKFEAAAKDLLGLMTKPAREFLAAAVSDFDLQTVADFLHRVAMEKEKLKAAGSDQGGDVIQMKEARS